MTQYLALLAALWMPGASFQPEPRYATVLVEPKAAKDHRVVEWVAEVAAPERVVVAEGQTVGDVVESACGSLGDSYLDLLRRRSIPGLPEDFTTATRFSESLEIELPGCLRLPPSQPRFAPQPRTVASGERPWDYFVEDQAGFRDFEPTRKVSARGTPASYLEAFKTLNRGYASSKVLPEGAEILVPSTPRSWVSLELGGSVETDAETLSTLSAHLAEAGQPPETILAESNEGLRIFSKLTSADLTRFGDCRDTSSVTTSRSAPFELLEVLAYDLSVLETWKDDPRGVVVVLPDTGLRSRGQSPFSAHRLEVDHDDEEGFYRRIQPHPRYENHQHGNYVGTLALGGTGLMPLLDWFRLPVRLLPSTLVHERPRHCGPGEQAPCWEHEVRPDSLSRAFDDAESKTGIVNLSIGQDKPLKQVAQILESKTDVLFVVAAGNDGEHLDDRSVYPARYGGDHEGRDNLITVAALDLDGTRAGFSNYGSSYVDIAAPGCAVPVLEHDPVQEAFRVIEASGTSFAAPQVSSTAALLRAVWPDAEAADLKRRILTSATISPLLEPDEVADRRQLHPVKALSVYQDVAEVRTEEGTRLLRGTVVQDPPVWRLCGLELHRRPSAPPNTRRKIKKIAVVPGTADSTRDLWLDYQDPAGRLDSRHCDVPEGWSIRFRDGFTGWVHELGADEVLDVVFAESPVG